MKCAAILAVVAAVAVSPCQAITSLRSGVVPALETNASAAVASPVSITPHTFMEVSLGPFKSTADACDYCFGSFTKEGTAPAGPIAPACVCAYPQGADFNMFCATPVSAAGYVADKGGCRCKGRDMEAMGSTTCEPIR
mmetsp:Transcript_16761/g.46428  ORF Transcript_16761/g.46428 Transcript_16761/m.46428 type:complete len:138 (+) Transcript_16761:89-502(+)